MTSTQPNTDGTGYTPEISETTARSSLDGLWADQSLHTDSIYGRLELPEILEGDEISTQPGKLLEFPNPVGTEELNHFIVFTVYHGIEGVLDTEDFNAMAEFQKNDLIWSAGAMVLGGGLGAFSTAKTINMITKSGKRFARLKKIGPILSLLAAGAGVFFAGDAGSAAHMASLSEEDREALTNFHKLISDSIDSDISNPENFDVNNNFNGRVTRIGKATFRHEDTIALYMPQKIQAMSLLEYEQQDMSTVQNWLHDWSGLAASAGFAQIPKFVDSIAGIFGMNTNITAGLYASLRIAPNPRKQLMFREPVSRKFEFNFNFSPRNETDCLFISPARSSPY